MPADTRSSLIYLAALISGAAALIYQVSWIGMLSMTFGSTTLASAAVIGAFMLSMGLGARAYDRISRRFTNPFRFYGLLEVGIAATAAGVSSLIHALPGVYAALAGGPEAVSGNAFLRLALAFILLLVPCLLMGATFPALCRAAIASRSALNRHLGPIYGLNTLGAALGALLAGLILIEWVGRQASIWIAGLGNLAAAAIAWALAQQSGVRHDTTAVAASADSDRRTPSVPLSVITVTLFVSGFATMAYEIFWLHAARYLVGNSSYALAIVLSVFLLGLGIGGVLHRRIAARAAPERDLAYCQALIALTGLIAVGIEAWILSGGGLSRAFSIFSEDMASAVWTARLLKTAIAAFIILLPPTLFMGLAFPLASVVYVRTVRQLGRDLGVTYLLANLGSIAGVYCGAIWLLPRFGITGGTKIVAALNLALALLLWLSNRTETRPRVLRLVAITIPGLLVALLLPPHLTFQGEFEQSEGHEVVFHEENDLGTVKVIHFPAYDRTAMTIDGYSIGVSRNFGRETGYKQEVIAHLPMVLRPDSRHTLNVGLGSASTLQALHEYPDLQTLDCVEISPAVVRAARFFAEGRVLDDPRVSIVVDDVLHTLMTSTRTYDVIISDGKQNPQFPGNSALLAAEFYDLALRHLARGGLFVQWIPLNYTPASFRAILGTFALAFPETAIYFLPPSCAVLVGSNEPIPVPWTLYAGRGVDSTLRASLLPYGIDRPQQILAGYVTDRAYLLRGLADFTPITWDRPALEFAAYKEFRPEESRLYVVANLDLLRRAAAPIDTSGGELIAPFLKSQALLREGLFQTAQTLDTESMRSYAERALEINPDETMARMFLFRCAQGVESILRPGRPPVRR